MALTASPLPTSPPDDGDVAIRPTDAVDPAAARRLQVRVDELVGAGHRTIVLDLTDVRTLDRAQLASVRRAAAKVDAAGGRLELLAG